jgi:hypothetical protein
VQADQLQPIAERAAAPRKKAAKQATLFDCGVKRNPTADEVGQQRARQDAAFARDREAAKTAAAATAAQVAATKRPVGRPRKEKKTADIFKKSKKGRKQHMNWWAPFLIFPILAAVAKWKSWQSAVSGLQKEHEVHGLYNALQAGTVATWFKPGSFTMLTPSATKMLSDSGRFVKPVGSGRKSILHGHDDVEAKIVTTLKSLRASGVAVNLATARALILAILAEYLPDVLASSFVASYSWVRRWLKAKLHWVTRWVLGV